MPLYRYRCSKCGHEFERLRKVEDREVVECPKCMRMVEIAVVPFSFVMKW